MSFDDLDERADIEKVKSQLKREGRGKWSYKGTTYHDPDNKWEERLKYHLEEATIYAALSEKSKEPEETLLDREAELACQSMRGVSINDYLLSEAGHSGGTKQFYDIAEYVLKRERERAEHRNHVHWVPEEKL